MDLSSIHLLLQLFSIYFWTYLTLWMKLFSPTKNITKCKSSQKCKILNYTNKKATLVSIYVYIEKWRILTAVLPSDSSTVDAIEASLSTSAFVYTTKTQELKAPNYRNMLKKIVYRYIFSRMTKNVIYLATSWTSKWRNT